MARLEVKKLFRYFPTKSAFDAVTKALDANNNTYLDGEGHVVVGKPEILWDDLCFIEVYPITSCFASRKIYTHGVFYGCADISNTITIAQAKAAQLHGLADALDVGETIDRIGEEATVENVLDKLNEGSTTQPPTEEPEETNS